MACASPGHEDTSAGGHMGAKARTQYVPNGAGSRAAFSAVSWGIDDEAT